MPKAMHGTNTNHVCHFCLSSVLLIDPRMMIWATKHEQKPVHSSMRYFRRKMTLKRMQEVEISIGTKELCRHSRKFSSSPSTHELKTRTLIMKRQQKEKRWTKMPRESLCHAKMPSFFTIRSFVIKVMIIGMPIIGYKESRNNGNVISAIEVSSFSRYKDGQ